MEIISSKGYKDIPNQIPKKVEATTGQEGYKTALNVVELPDSPKVVASGEHANGQASEKQIKNAINQANTKLAMKRTKCEFSYHEETKRISIKVVDQDTKEVIREIPPEETLQIVERMWELAGILIDEKR